MRIRMPVAWSLVVLLLATAASTPQVASADSDQVAERATVTYRLDRRKAEVDVRAAFTITNRIPSTRTTRFLIKEWGYIVVPSYAQDFRVTGRNVSRRLDKQDEDWRYYVVRFPRIMVGQRVSFTATWSLPSRGAGSSNPTRVTDAYAHFCWYGQPADTGSISTVLPRGVDQETSGSSVKTRTRDGATTLSARQRANLITFGACTDVYDPDLLIRREFTSPAGHPVAVEGWPGDETWLDTTAANVVFALETLEAIVGAPIPGDDQIVVRETAGNALAGYAGYFDSDSGVIRLNEQSSAAVTVAHAIAGAWFSRAGFKDSWMYEGLAEWAARTAVERPCVEPSSYPGKGSPKLRKWRQYGYQPSQAQIDLIAYQYEASCAIVTRIGDIVGAERMRDVIGVLLDGRSPYDRLTGSLPAAPTVGQAASPTSAVVSPTAPSWSPTSSSARRRDAVDWRQWLDVVEELGFVAAGTTDATIAQELLVSHGIATAKQLRGRDDARAAFHVLRAVTPAGVTPAVVRRLMDDWRFEDAQTATSRATEVAIKLLVSPLAGRDPTSGPWQAFESARRTQDLERVAAMVE